MFLNKNSKYLIIFRELNGEESAENLAHPLVIQMNMYYRQIYHNHLHQQKKEDHLQMIKQFLVNIVNKYNAMTMGLKMMMIVFSIRGGENMYFMYRNTYACDVFIYLLIFAIYSLFSFTALSHSYCVYHCVSRY